MGRFLAMLLCLCQLVLPVQDYPELTQRIFDEGHEIGFHGYSHKNMKNMSRRDIAAELEQSQALLPKGCVPAFLRPPGGCCW